MRGCGRGGDGDGKAEACKGLEHGASRMRAQRVVGRRRRTQNPKIAWLVAIGPNYDHTLTRFDTDAKYTFGAVKDYSTSVCSRLHRFRKSIRWYVFLGPISKREPPGHLTSLSADVVTTLAHAA